MIRNFITHIATIKVWTFYDPHGFAYHPVLHWYSNNDRLGTASCTGDTVHYCPQNWLLVSTHEPKGE